MAYRIAVVGGDGIGPEVTAEALKVVRASGVEIDTVEFELGGARYLNDGEILSDETLEELRAFDAILLGAVGDPRVPPGVIERGLLLKINCVKKLLECSPGSCPPSASSSSSSPLLSHYSLFSKLSRKIF